MKPLPFIQASILAFCVSLTAGNSVFSQDVLTGSYTMQTGEVLLNLTLTQQGNTLQGTLQGNTGASFQLSGQVENGIGYGTCSGAEGTVYFEVYADGQDLTLSLVEPDQWGNPDYNTAQYLPFVKTSSMAGTPSAGSPGGAVTGALGLTPSTTPSQPGQTTQPGYPRPQTYSQPVQPTHPQQSYQPGYNQGVQAAPGQQYQTTYPQAAQGPGMSGNASVGENEVGDPSWGLKFGLPQGWVRKNTQQGAIVGHNTIPGMVLVIPHMAQNLQEMQQEMQQGLQEEGSYLMPSGGIQQRSQNILAGDYTGIADGTQVKARGYGVLSPNGGGAYLIAMSTPDKLGQELLGAANSMLNNVSYFKVDVSALTQHFTGTWAHFSSNTSTWMTFHPDGRYEDQYEASYSGDFTDGAGNWTGNWGAMGEDSDAGRWTVRGNKDSGTIIVRKANGEEIYYEYRVHMEDGQKYYHEYYFNGDFYSKK